jgi:hypothetical protein
MKLLVIVSLFGCFVAVTLVCGAPLARAVDLFPSWNDDATKNSIINCVGGVSKEGSPEFVRQAERIAVFDNDGTLWCEQAMYFSSCSRSTTLSSSRLSIRNGRRAT